jgi:hypothetical protein
LQAQIEIKLKIILHFVIGLSMLASAVATQTTGQVAGDQLMIIDPNQTEIKSIEEISVEVEEEPKQFKTTREYVEEYFNDAPIMIDVAYCESRFRQFNENGTPLRGKVNSADVGVMQINEKYHAATAVKLGLNLETLDGNLAYARYLYETQGTKPWVHSSKCWNSVREVAFAN